MAEERECVGEIGHRSVGLEERVVESEVVEFRARGRGRRGGDGVEGLYCVGKIWGFR